MIQFPETLSRLRELETRYRKLEMLAEERLQVSIDHIKAMRQETSMEASL